GRCCATPWVSKGYRPGAAEMANATVAALWRWTHGGELPVVCDASSCTLGLAEDVVPLLDEQNTARHAKLGFLDSGTWARRLLPELKLERRLRSATVHPPCASRHLETDADLVAVAHQLAHDVVVPVTTTCCGFAGDRGLLHPELALAATADEAAEVAGHKLDAHLCSNRTCEIGLQQGTGERYESFLYPLEELSRA
ncbi:MAG: heterodisulfide reductase-related iron-sulfur binding cluster, partial [Solirubrobacterales bacterium]